MNITNDVKTSAEQRILSAANICLPPPQEYCRKMAAKNDKLALCTKI